MVVALAAMAVVLAGPGVSVAGVDVGAGCAEAEGLPAGLIVDFGDVAGSPGGVEARCVPVAGRTTGADVLLDAGYELRFERGLLCAINGFPADGCGDRNGSGRQYHYWSYWRAEPGASGWTYSAIGPDGARVSPGAMEGWRYVLGRAAPTDPQPRVAPDLVATCGQAPAPEPPAPQPQDGPAPGGGPPGAAPGAPAGRANPPADQGAPASSVPPADAPATDQAGATATTTTTAPPAGAALALDGGGRDGEPVEAAAAASTTSPAGGGQEDDPAWRRWIAPVGGLVLVAALVGGAVVVSRRRQPTEL